MEHIVHTCQELKNRAINYPNFIKTIVMGDENWINGYMSVLNYSLTVLTRLLKMRQKS